MPQWLAKIAKANSTIPTAALLGLVAVGGVLAKPDILRVLPFVGAVGASAPESASAQSDHTMEIVKDVATNSAHIEHNREEVAELREDVDRIDHNLIGLSKDVQGYMRSRGYEPERKIEEPESE